MNVLGVEMKKPGVALAEEERGKQPGFSHGQMAAQLHDLRKVEAAKKEFEEYVRQQVSPRGGRGGCAREAAWVPRWITVCPSHCHRT